MSLDALTYASIKNSATENSDYAHFGRMLVKSPLYSGIKKKKDIYLNKILDKTTIKRACCKGITSADNSNMMPISVRIPIPTDVQQILTKDKTLPPNKKQYTPGDTTQYTQFKYHDKIIEIPKAICAQVVPNYKTSSNACDDFYEVYCQNAKKFFKARVGYENYDHNKFVAYKPECACYGDTTGFTSLEFPKKCMFQGCADKAAYLDPSSVGESCNLKICQNIINAANADVGGNMNIKVNATNACGGQLGEEKERELNTMLDKAERKKAQVAADEIAAEKAESDRKAAEKAAAAKAIKDKKAAEKAAVEKAAKDDAAKKRKIANDAAAAATKNPKDKGAAEKARKAKDEADKAAIDAEKASGDKDKADVEAAQANRAKENAEALEKKNKELAEQKAIYNKTQDEKQNKASSESSEDSSDSEREALLKDPKILIGGGVCLFIIIILLILMFK